MTPSHSQSSPDHPVSWPAEWAPHEACWLAWPHLADEWLGDLASPRRAVAALAAAIADVDPHTGQARGERIEMLVNPAGADAVGPDGNQHGGQGSSQGHIDDTEASAREALAGVPARFHRIPYGDIWLRDTGPIFVHSAGGPHATCFGWNGWGGKYLFAHDPEVGARIANAANTPSHASDWILEGGAVDGDGQGTVLTTRECLLNPNRNPGLGQAAVEARLARDLGAQTVIWLDRGLHNDHTDGHVDNLARFVAPGRVLCMRARDRHDPNREVLDQIARDLAAARDAAGRALEVVEIPAPGPVTGPDGAPMPASYMNYYLGNTTVVVPVYGTPHDDEAVRIIASQFPGRRTLGVDARAVLVGGGAFHCISREQPRMPFALANAQGMNP